MNRSIIATLLAAVLVTPVLPQQQTQQDQAQPAATPKGVAKFSTTRQLVVVDVTAKDKDGKPIKGLKPAHFAISEDGKKQDISVFEYQELEEILPAPPPVPAIKKPPPEQSPQPKATLSTPPSPPVTPL